MNIIEEINKEQVEKLVADNEEPIFAPGDTLKVNVRVVEGTRERVQAFEGVCIARKNAGLNSAVNFWEMVSATDMSVLRLAHVTFGP